jgi:TRAP transporter TAXI family solute receptor
MLYILILVIIISIAIYKTNIITSNYLSNSENFKSNNYSLLNERGISIDVKLNKEYILATGEIDTPYHNIGKAIDNITTIPLELMLTNGSITNLELLEKGRVDFALCQEDILYDMALGLNRFNNKKLNNIRFVTSLYDELFYLIVPKTSNINNFQVLKNGFSIKGENYIIGTSSDGSGSLEILKMMCNLFSIELVKVELDQIIKNTDKNVLYYIDKNINTNCNLLINNKIDGIFYVTGPKTSYVVNLSQVLPIKFISLYDEQFDILNKLSGNKYKKGNIKIQEDSINTIENRDVPTQSVRSVLVCRKDLDETLVYNFTKEIYKNIDYVKNFMVNQNSIFSNLGVLGTENIVESNN